MGLSDSTLMKIALDVMSGVYEANLGGGVIKKRLALPWKR
ncbi:type II toxin-antitoxin system RelE/ParE family toxin [Morganella morganii]